MSFDSREHYEACIRDKGTLRQHIEHEYGQHPELFPPEMADGFIFHDSRISAKLKLKTRHILKAAYDFDSPNRTTNCIDRLMGHQESLLYAMRYFHRELSSGSLAMRSMALLWNLHPYGIRARPSAARKASPFCELNGFSYHDNWLMSLQIASSMGGWRTRPTAKRRRWAPIPSATLRAMRRFHVASHINAR